MSRHVLFHTLMVVITILTTIHIIVPTKVLIIMSIIMITTAIMNAAPVALQLLVELLASHHQRPLQQTLCASWTGKALGCCRKCCCNWSCKVYTVDIVVGLLLLSLSLSLSLIPASPPFSSICYERWCKGEGTVKERWWKVMIGEERWCKVIVRWCVT